MGTKRQLLEAFVRNALLEYDAVEAARVEAEKLYAAAVVHANKHAPSPDDPDASEDAAERWMDAAFWYIAHAKTNKVVKSAATTYLELDFET